MLLMEDTTHRLTAKAVLTVTTDPLSINSMCAIQQTQHPVCNRFNITHFYKESFTVPYNRRDATYTRGKHRTSACHGLHQHTAKCLEFAGENEASAAPHEFCKFRLRQKSMKRNRFYRKHLSGKCLHLAARMSV